MKKGDNTFYRNLNFKNIASSRVSSLGHVLSLFIGEPNFSQILLVDFGVTNKSRQNLTLIIIYNNQ